MSDLVQSLEPLPHSRLPIKGREGRRLDILLISPRHEQGSDVFMFHSPLPYDLALSNVRLSNRHRPPSSPAGSKATRGAAMLLLWASLTQ